jgi:putative addiction module component (TIGR02574 family)
MASELTAQQIIDSALLLPLADREHILHVLQDSVIDEQIDHGPEEPADEVEAAWGEEIARRIADIDSGRVKTIPSEEAWKMINAKTRPNL